MSDFGDVFYEYDVHVQDACLKEIEKCQVYILVIGNNYGSIYHKNQPSKEFADSVTLKEFTKSISVNIPKHVFINRFVQYDYQNYRRILDGKLKEYFDTHEVIEKDVTIHKQKIRKEFDSTYPFPQPSYRYIFHFLDIIHNLKINNAIFAFETVEDIKLALKKQWAGYMYEKLTESRLEKIEQAQKERLDEIALRVGSIEKMLQNLFSEAHPVNGKLSFDVGKYINSFAYDSFESVKDILSESLESIMSNDYFSERCTYNKKLTDDIVHQWLVSLDSLVKKYKWSKTIPLEEVLSTFSISFSPKDVDYDCLLRLSGLFASVQEEDKVSFISSVKLYLEKFEVVQEEEIPEIFPEEEIPF